MRHRWQNGDYCAVCGLYRSGYGRGPYGMRYYLGGDHRTGTLVGYKPGQCPGASAAPPQSGTLPETQVAPR